jgi:hypothetical protein
VCCVEHELARGDDVLLAIGQSPSEFADEARFLLAVTKNG